MKKSEFRGFSQVFKFTLIQTVRQKSYYITLIIMLLFSALAFPVMSILNGGGDSGDSSENMIEEALVSYDNVYFVNNITSEKVSLESLKESQEYYSDIKIIDSNEDVETLCKKIRKENEDAVVVSLESNQQTGGYVFKLYYDPASKVSDAAINNLASDVGSWFEDYKLELQGIDEDTVSKISKGISVEVNDYENYEADKEGASVISETDYNLVYAVLMVFYMIIILAASLVANKVVEEKSNRIVEYLMTTVRPMALMLGKIIAMLVASVMEVVAIIAVGAISNYITNTFISPVSSDILANVISENALESIQPLNILLCVLIMAVGIVIYGLIAGLFGASVSRTEDTQQGLKTFSILILLAFFAAIASQTMMSTVGINGFVKFTMYFPFTSVMVLPGLILIGKATVVDIIISVVIMVVTTLILLWAISLVYETVIVMNGNPIKFGKMIEIAKNSISKGKGAKINEK